MRYILIFLVGVTVSCTPSTQTAQEVFPVATALQSDTSGYARATEARTFRFPYDHGTHPAYKVEWWYVTGHLKTTTGREFGYQFTVFRNALAPKVVNDSSQWRTRQLYMGHLALTDVSNGTFYAYERFARGDGRLAGGDRPTRIWLEDWEFAGSDDGGFPFTLTARTPEFYLSLQLDSLKPYVLQGDGGLSQKSPEQGNASYYYSYTRLQTNGSVRIEKDSFSVTGTSWLDREWSTSALGKNQVGWDWFSLQLDDGSELMYYQLRQKDGSADPVSSGTCVASDGSCKRIAVTDVELAVTELWTSEATGVTYPSGWILSIPDEDLQLTVSPILKNQELDLTVSYWEGAVRIAGTKAGKPISGQGYVELTGYNDQRKPSIR